jgi:RNA polymerase sigma factor (sigma-70 family)
MTFGGESSRDLGERARAAAAGDRAAAADLLDAIKDGVYRLALRMLGHPADAEDATQEILVIVLTHLGTFRGESAFTTWVWRIAANHLGRVRRGRREQITLEVLGERLTTGLRLRPEAEDGEDPETQALAGELRLRCTQAMLLGLDRDHRIAYLLGDVFGLSGEEAAQVLSIDRAAYRKRLSRARRRLHEFIRERCGVFDPANACRCAAQVECAKERGLVAAEELVLSRHPVTPDAPTAPRAEQAARELTGLMRAAQVMRQHPQYAAPEAMIARLRELVDSGRLELLRP